MRLAVIGAGYVGLVTAACLAKLDHRVVCIDVDATRIRRLSGGNVPLTEPHLDRLVADGLKGGRLRFASSLNAAAGARLAIIAVGTLNDAGEWSGDNVRAAVRQIAADPRAPREIVIRSTLMPGTTRRLTADLLDDRAMELAVNPEFTREGSAVSDFFRPDRVVIGATDPAGAVVSDLRRLYSPLDSPIVVTDLTSAETIKVASNVFLAAKVSFANELARICEASGAHVQDVVDGMGLDSRIGRAFLSPGPGVGGSCLPNQARALPALAAELGVKAPLIEAIAPSNVEHVDWLLDRVEEAMPTGFSEVTVAVLGVTFKAGTDDIRESPALRLAAGFAARGAAVAMHDPISTAAGVAWLAGQGVVARDAATPADAAVDADILVVATEWPTFMELDWAQIADAMRGNLVVDARGILSRETLARHDLRVVGILQRQGVTPPPRRERAVAGPLSAARTQEPLVREVASGEGAYPADAELTAS